MSLLRRRGIAAARREAAPEPDYFASFDAADNPDRFAHGGQGFMFQRTSGTNSRQVRTWDAVPDNADVEVLAKLAVIRDDQRWGVAVRVAGSSSSETGYVFQQESRAVGNLRLVSYDAGTSSVVDATLTGEPYTMVQSRWFWLRFRVNGTTLKGKFWLDGEPEPTTGGTDDDGYQLKVTDSAVAGAGRVGLFQFDAGAGDDPEFDDPKYCDYIAAGLNGAVAPGPADTPGTDQYAEDFSGFTPSLSDVPAGWSAPWGSSWVQTRVVDHGMARRLMWDGWRPFWNSALTRNDDPSQRWSGGGNDRKLYGWHAIGEFGDVEVDCRMRSTVTTGDQLRLHARSGGLAGTESGYFIDMRDGNEIRLGKYSPGFNVLDDAAFSWTTHTWYRLRLRCEGSVIKGKAWADGTTEPTSGGPDGDGYQLKATDTAHTTGHVGFGSFAGDGIKDVADFAVIEIGS